MYVCINWRIIALQCCVGFWRVSTWFNHRYIGIRMFPPSWSSVPSYPTPLGCHRAQGWASCVVYQIPTVCLFHMVLYMFQCYSVNLPYSLLPSLHPQVCALRLRLCCCPANRSISPIFLDFICLLLLFSHSVMSNSLRPRGLQHARRPYPSPSPGACSNLCPLSQWCHPTISSSVSLFSCLQPFPGSFPVGQLFASGGQRLGASASASTSFQEVFRTDLL